MRLVVWDRNPKNEKWIFFLFHNGTDQNIYKYAAADSAKINRTFDTYITPQCTQYTYTVYTHTIFYTLGYNVYERVYLCTCTPDSVV